MGADWLLPIYGLIVGTLVGLTGMGGGVLMTPLLVLGLGMPATAAVGTDLAYSSITKLAGTWQHARHHRAARRASSEPFDRQAGGDRRIWGIPGRVDLDRQWQPATALLVITVSLTPEKLVGTDVAHSFLLVGAAALAHLFVLNDVDVALAGNLLVGSIPGVLIGSRLTVWVPRRPLQAGLAVLLLTTALSLLR